MRFSRPLIIFRFSAKSALVLFLLFLSAFSAPGLWADTRISEYEAVFRTFYDGDGNVRAAVRRFNRGDEWHFLVLDPQRFTLIEMAAAKVLTAPAAGEEAWRATPFSRALLRQTAPPYPLQNDGLRQSEHDVHGFFLTGDLCPSKKPLDRRLIEATAALPQTSPVPVALMVSGLWILRHEADFAWLRDRASAGRLSITWVNHSFTHAYDPSAPLERNFLLAAKTDFIREVLSLEKLLIERGLTPSPFFRFPGLVSSRSLIEELRNLSLIPIGSNAWLAKGEKPQPGSVILVHGNGNEPEGIRRLLSFYEERRHALVRGDEVLLPLSEAFLP